MKKMNVLFFSECFFFHVTHLLYAERTARKGALKSCPARVHWNLSQFDHGRRDALFILTRQVQVVVPIGSKRVENVEPPESLADAFHLMI